jgi:cell division protein FtsQ
MRDYKNVKVPKKYRTTSRRTSVKRVETTRTGNRAKQSGTRIQTVLVTLLVTTAIAGSCWLGWQAYRLITKAETFQIAGVDVKGVRQLSGEDLKNIAGVFTGQNIFSVDLDEAARRARANPWIRDVRIYRQLPNRISMTVVERVPVAVLETGSGRYLIDSEAVVIDRATDSGASPWLLPSIRIRDAQAHPGEPVTAGAMAEALELLAEISARGGWKLSDVTLKADSPETLSIVYAACEFKIGSGRYTEKLRRLVEVMADVQRRGLNVAYVDLRPERQAAVMAVKNNTPTFGVRGSASKRTRR